MTSEIRAGQIWQMSGSAEVALVAFVWRDELFGEDVRVLPVFVGPEHAAQATERDIVIPAEHSSLNAELLVNCWNGQVVSRNDLMACVGDVSARALEAAHAVEMIGLAPDPANDFADWVGAPLESDVDPRLASRRSYYDRWQEVRARQATFRDAYEILIKAPRSLAGLFRGEDGQTGEFSVFTMPVTSISLPVIFSASTVTEAGDILSDDDTALRAA